MRDEGLGKEGKKMEGRAGNNIALKWTKRRQSRVQIKFGRNGRKGLAQECARHKRYTGRKNATERDNEKPPLGGGREWGNPTRPPLKGGERGEREGETPPGLPSREGKGERGKGKPHPTSPQGRGKGKEGGREGSPPAP